jgi:single-stranded-DNA-specific exonuclease
MLQQRWEVKNPENEIVSKIMSEYGVTRPVAVVLANRNFSMLEIGSFLKPQLKDLSDPYDLPDIKIACRRLWHAIRNQERILIFGDYDTDGMTSTALLEWVLRKNGALTDSFLPNRLEDGYGLTTDTVEKCLSDHRLIITVDCGITSCSAIDAANRRGVDVIVTDHHQPGKDVPNALAIINPKLHPETTDLQVLAGVGVCFKLCHAFVKYGRENNLGGLNFDLKEGLDLVALGTVADIVPLTGENRCMVKHGIRILSEQKRPGVRALCEVAGIDNELDSTAIAYRLAPRLNAAGRLGYANDALKLLRSTSIVDAYPLAKSLDRYNRTRKSYEEQIFKLAKANIKQMDLRNCHAIVVADKNWHSGVIGIVASRLCQEFCRPAIVLSVADNGEILGSGRSIPRIDLLEALYQCRKLLDRFGGHPMAAGLTLAEENLAAFTRTFQTAVREICAEEFDLTPVLSLDGSAELGEMDEQFYSEIQVLQPFGESNPSPVFRFNDVKSDRLIHAGKNAE